MFSSPLRSLDLKKLQKQRHIYLLSIRDITFRGVVGAYMRGHKMGQVQGSRSVVSNQSETSTRYPNADVWATYCLSGQEKETLTRAAIDYLAPLGAAIPIHPSRQATVCRTFATTVLLNACPALSELARRIKSGAALCLYVTGLPVDRQISALIAAALGYLLGELFNYSTQNGGDLLMRVAPTDWSPPHTSTTREDLGFHTSDAIMAAEHRVHFVGLYGMINPPETRTGYAAIEHAVSHMQSRSLEILSEPRYTIRAPHSFHLARELWSGPRAILTRSADGRVRIAWSTYATNLLHAEDTAAANAIIELRESLETVVHDVRVDPGCWLAFDNNRGLVRRSAIGSNSRLVYRTYSIESLETLQSDSGEEGPIFNLEKILGGLTQ